MVNICITTDGDTEDVADYVAFVAEQIREGYTSGILSPERNWDSE